MELDIGMQDSWAEWERAVRSSAIGPTGDGQAGIFEGVLMSKSVQSLLLLFIFIADNLKSTSYIAALSITPNKSSDTYRPSVTVTNNHYSKSRAGSQLIHPFWQMMGHIRVKVMPRSVFTLPSQLIREG